MIVKLNPSFTSRTFFILLLFLQYTLFCQFNLSPSLSLVKKYHVKKIIAYTILRDSTREGWPRYIFQYDQKGNLISSELAKNPASERDYGHFTGYVYKNGQMTEMIMKVIGPEAQIDSIVFTNDSKARPLTRVTNNYYLKENTWVYTGKNIIRYNYPNDTTTILTEEVYKSSPANLSKMTKVSRDTLIYNRNKLLLCEISQTRKEKVSYVYNSKKQLVSRTVVRQDTAAQGRKDSYVYKDGHMILEVNQYINKKSKNFSDSIEYINNKNGLPKETKRYMGHSLSFSYLYY